MYRVTQEYSATPIFEGSKNECRKFLRSKVDGRLRKIVNHSWEDERNLTCWCTQTDRTFEVTKV